MTYPGLPLDMLMAADDTLIDTIFDLIEEAHDA